MPVLVKTLPGRVSLEATQQFHDEMRLMSALPSHINVIRLVRRVVLVADFAVVFIVVVSGGVVVFPVVIAC